MFIDLAVAHFGFRILVQRTFTTGGFVKLRSWMQLRTYRVCLKDWQSSVTSFNLSTQDPTLMISPNGKDSMLMNAN